MFNEPVKDFLYSAYKIYVEHSDGIKTLNGTATGFILEIAKGIPWIITNRHVIDLNYKKTTSKYKDFKLSKLIISGRKSDDTEYSFELHENALFYFHDNLENDIVIIRAHVYFVGDKKFHWHFGMNSLATEAIFKEIEIFDLICYSGFPKTHDKLANRPILRSGHIASDPKFDYSWDSNYQGQCIAYEGFSSEGASGSPIIAPSRGIEGLIESRTGYLIGVNAGHIPEQNGHSGISYFYKTTVIMEIIEKNKLLEVTNQ